MSDLSSDGAVTEERRQSPRARIGLQFQVRSNAFAGVQNVEAVDISRSGILLTLARSVPLGSVLELELPSPDAPGTYRARAEVVRVVSGPSPGVGARFLLVSDALVALIDRLLMDDMALANFELQALIGTGGMAELYRARGLQGAWQDKTVAVKRLRPELVRDEAVRALFEVEGELLAKLDHPSIVRFLGRGEAAGAPYLVLEYVGGPTLRQLIDAVGASGRPLPVSVACYVVRDVAEALHHVHASGVGDVVHRDATPSNILIAPDGSVRLTDFGIVSIASDRRTQWRGVTAGNPMYMAPEQRQHRRLSGATDVFTLGLVLYELLVGRPYRETQGKAPPLSTARDDLPPGLEAVVSKALAPVRVGRFDGWLRGALADLTGRDRRYDSARAFAEALAPFARVGEEPHEAREALREAVGSYRLEVRQKTSGDVAA